jgi:serine/threonine protein kinase/ketosteroid isomerase-like protein
MLGRTIENKYRIDAQLGTGGMGTVYRATRLLIGDAVAVKVLHPQLVKDDQAAERFRREAQAAARLKHPNVVTVHDFGITDDGLVYLVMEFVEGESLRHVIRRGGALTLVTAAEIMRQLCAALDEAHESGIVHRDVKPDNIIVRETPRGLRVKVLDFGIARLRDIAPAANNLTQTGTVMGTPHYMSPEQCLGEEADHRADIYSAGVILYEMLTGTVPFNSPTPTAVAVQHATQQPLPPRAINMSVPPEVEAAVLHALQKRREDRPQTAGAFTQELADAINEVTLLRNPKPGAQPVHSTQPTVVITKPAWQGSAVSQSAPTSHHQPPPKSSRSLLMAASGLLAGLVIAGAAVALWAGTQANKNQTGDSNIAADSVSTKNTEGGRGLTTKNTPVNAPTQRTAVPASTPPPASPPLDLSRVRGEVAATIEAWVAATRAHDFEAHMSYYADTLRAYYKRSNVGSDYVRADRARAFTRYSKLDIQLNDISVNPDSSGLSATAVFDKTWNFEGEKYSSGAVRQMLWLAKVGDRWLITGEKDLKVIYVNR